MKSFGFCVLLLLFGTALVCLASTITCSPSGTAFNLDKQDIAEPATSRKLKDAFTNPSLSSQFLQGLSASRDKTSDGQLNLEDYGPNDPAPSSKASVRPGPIQHGTPLMPYIPKPSPAAPPTPPAPGHPKLGALP